MAKTAAVVVAVLACLLAATGAQASDDAGFILWQGFNFQWLHKFIGFETPHRLGSFANYVDNQTLLVTGDTAALYGTYHMTFTPGVDGDYAYPATFMTGLVQTEAASSSPVYFAQGSVTVAFSDNATGPSSAPYALSNEAVPFTVEGVPNAANAEVLLNGVDMAMKCASASCNSNGIWATLLNFSIIDCSATSATSLQCVAAVQLERGWTPSHGGGKAFNPVMAYNLRMSYAVISGSTADFAYVRDSQHVQSDIFAGTQTGNVTVNGPSGYSAYAVGMRGFAFELLETDKHANRGRYMEQLEFRLDQGTRPWEYAWTAGFVSPSLTTYKSDCTYTIDASVLAFSSAVATSGQTSAEGAVCEDDKPTSFKCSSKNLPQDLSDAVPVKVQVSL